MISLADFMVVILAVGIVLAFVFTMRRFLRLAQQNEAAEDDPPAAAARHGRGRSS
jgi:uncharacterized membrane protein YqiK